MTKNMGDVLWTKQEVEKATKGKSEGKDFQANSVSIDSRDIQGGEIFVALKGPLNDGHNFVEQALKDGAVVAIVEESFDNKGEELNLIKVPDTLKALEDLGQAARARTKAKIIGITGSVGKTGTKELLHIALEPLGKTHASIKSYNNHWGVPLTLANLPADAEYAVFEMGMNNPGEMRVLSSQVRPEIAIITTIEPAHIGHFSSVEEIADAKAEIFEGMNEDAKVVLNIDNPYFKRLEKAAIAQGIEGIYGFGEDEEAEACLMDCKLRSDSSKVTAVLGGDKVRYKLPIPGKHIVMNSLAAMMVVHLMGSDMEKSIQAIRHTEPVEGRGSQTEVILEEGKPPLLLIDESYNASPASMEAAFKVLEMVKPLTEEGRRIAVIGDMLELGAEGPILHAALATPLLKAQADQVFTCGPLSEALFDIIPPAWQGVHGKDSQEIASIVAAAVRPGDVVLIKGSQGSKMAYVVRALQDLHVTEVRRNAV